MLTRAQLAILRSEPKSNRLGKAISLARVTQLTIAKALGLSPPYVNDVAHQRHRTITLKNARKFARYFGCTIEDLFPTDGDEAACSTTTDRRGTGRSDLTVDGRRTADGTVHFKT